MSAEREIARYLSNHPPPKPCQLSASPSPTCQSARNTPELPAAEPLQQPPAAMKLRGQLETASNCVPLPAPRK